MSMPLPQSGAPAHSFSPPTTPAVRPPKIGPGEKKDWIEKLSESPKFLDRIKLARNALTGGGVGNMLFSLALGGALHPVGLGIGIALGVGIRYLEKKGCFKPLAAFLDSRGKKMENFLHIRRKATARGKRMAGNVLDLAGDATFLAESISAAFKSFSKFAQGVNALFYPLNVVAKVVDLPLDVKNFQDLVENQDPSIDRRTRRQNLHAEFFHMAFGFLETAGALIPPVNAVAIGLNVTLQALGFAANRWRDSRDLRQKWLQGYDTTKKDPG